MKTIASNLTSGGQAYNPRAVAKLVDAVMNQKQTQEVLLYLDPKQQQQFGKTDHQQHHFKPDPEGFAEATVFVIGGGNFFEYTNVTQLMAQPENKGKQVVYGCTDIVNGVEFTEELALLGSK